MNFLRPTAVPAQLALGLNFPMAKQSRRESPDALAECQGLFFVHHRRHMATTTKLFVGFVLSLGLMLLSLSVVAVLIYVTRP